MVLSRDPARGRTSQSGISSGESEGCIGLSDGQVARLSAVELESTQLMICSAFCTKIRYVACIIYWLLVVLYLRNSLGLIAASDHCQCS